MLKTPILQFGTSRFLQAHADLFLSEARAGGQDVGPVTVVQTSGDPTRVGRVQALSKGFPVRIEGLVDGAPVQEIKQVTSIARGLSTATDWATVTRVFVEEAEIVLSNTGDAGFAPSAVDAGEVFDQAMSFPAKLCHLLRARFEGGARPIQIMPMELIANNGAVLKKRVLELAQADTSAFRAYLERDVLWVNALVDRIVSQPLEPAGAVAEPYALWAIEAQPGLASPCAHPAVQIVPSLAEIEALKLFVLNLGHTVLADRWLREARGAGVLVRHVMSDPAERDRLLALYSDEVRPAFVAAGQGQAFETYVETTLERFGNPFLDHAIADIAQNHAQKVARRIAAFLDFAARHGDIAPKPRLSEIVARQKEAA
ncbi:mannitol dehydrogenase family protein [Pacificoceanicola onchidii]|uniref:mannitol dehydrogenase family protein n=1 Tax=Pacificoceanicola onchidii TaxID=2562685 RepID=UPI0010A61322|nr:mannitol dehydrogenase family protein [Pacificoceanicola onchidii]